VDFYINVLVLPEEFTVNCHNNEVKNFSFDAHEKQITTKTTFVKEELFNFVTNSSEILIDFHYEDKLSQIVDILNKQKGLNESEVIRKEDSSYSGYGHILKDKNVFNQSLGNPLNTFGSSLTNHLSEAKKDSGFSKPAENTHIDEKQINSITICHSKQVQKNETAFQEDEENASCLMIVRAKCTSKKQVEKDLSFVKGDVIEVYVKHNNGWMVGKNLRTGQSGYLPITFVEPIDLK
jgi:hypothetical protein